MEQAPVSSPKRHFDESHSTEELFAMPENIKEDIALLQELLRDSDEKFRLLYESEPFVYDSLDENGIILEVSQGWLNLLGYTRDEVIGHWLGEFYTP